MLVDFQEREVNNNEKKQVSIEEKIEEYQIKLEAIRISKIIAPLLAIAMFILTFYIGITISSISVSILILAYGLFSKSLKNENIDLREPKRKLKRMDYILALNTFPIVTAVALNNIDWYNTARIVCFIIAPILSLAVVLYMEKHVKDLSSKLKKEKEN